jgi:hypothetical protein
MPIGSMYGIYANIGGILMVNVTIYSILHGSYGMVYSVYSPWEGVEVFYKLVSPGMTGYGYFVAGMRLWSLLTLLKKTRH